MRARGAAAGVTPSSRRATALTLTLCVGVGLVLRLLPWLLDPGFALRSDAAYHVRLVSLTVAQSRMPERDTLSEAPEGRRLAEHLPFGLYVAAAAFHRTLSPLDHADVRTHLIALIALAGALVTIPVYFATRAVGGTPRAGWLAAFVIATLPGHLHRTFGYWVRYDALGVTLLVAHLAFALRALRHSRTRWVDALAATLFAVAAASVWRVSLVFPVLEAAFALAVLTARGAEPPLRDWMLATAALGTAAFAMLPPMAAQHFIGSGAWVFVIAAAVGCVMPWGGRGSRPWRRVVVAACVMGAALVVTWRAGASPYPGTLELLAVKLRQLVAGAPNVSPWSRLQLDVLELYGLTPGALLIGPQQFLALGPWFIAAPFVLRRLAGRTWRQALDALAGPTGLLAFVSLAFIVLTLVFSRNKVLPAPCVAVTFGRVGAAIGSWRSRGAPSPSRGAGKDPRRRSGTTTDAGNIAFVVRTLFALCVAATAVCGVMLAASRRPDLIPDLDAAAAFLRSHTRTGAIVAAPWQYGYDLQSLADRPTAVDGLLESPENRRRILELYAAFMARDASQLARFCAQQHVGYVVVPPFDDLSHIAWVVEPAMAEHIEAGANPTPDEMRCTLLRLMRGETVPNFETVYANATFRVARARRPAP